MPSSPTSSTAGDTSETSTSGTTGDSEGVAEKFPACVKYVKTAAGEDLERCADELMPACQALVTLEDCDDVPRLDGRSMQLA